MRETVGSIAKKQSVLENELARMRAEQSEQVRQLEELDALKCRADAEKARELLAERELSFALAARVEALEAENRELRARLAEKGGDE